MELKTAAVAFATVFLAELGDKTQLATLALASKPGAKWMVFAGASLALVCTTALAIALAGVIGQYVPEHWVKRGAGALFLILGILYLKDSL